MDDVLLDSILSRLDAEPLGDPSADLLLAACQGTDALDAALGGVPPDRPERSGRGGADRDAEPVGAYLRSITVQASAASARRRPSSSSPVRA